MKLLPILLLATALTGTCFSVSGQTTAKKPASSTGATPVTKPATKSASGTSAKAAKPATAKPPIATTPPPAKPASAHSEAGPAPSPRPALITSSSSGISHTGSSSKNDQFGVGTTAVNLGIGLINFGSYSGLLFGSSDISRTPLMNLSVEHGIIDGVGPGIISVGGLVGYRRASYTYDGLYGYKWSASDLFVGVRGAYHYQLTPQLDTYGGLTLGIWHSSYKWTWNDSTPDYLRYGGKDSWTRAGSGLFVGARYYFTDNIGAFGEFGYDLSLLKLGLSAKF